MVSAMQMSILSYPSIESDTRFNLKLPDDFLDRSFPETESEGQSNPRCPPLRATKSLNSSPTVKFKHGIPLGSLTAQLASKCFWNQDMLKKSMEQIAQCAVQEVSCIGSSVESLQDSEEWFSDADVIQISGEENNAESPEARIQPEQVRELRNPFTILSERKRTGFETPPYLSPGITRRFHYSHVKMDT